MQMDGRLRRNLLGTLRRRINPTHRYGVAIIVCKSIGRSVAGFLPLSGRVMLIKLDAKPFPLNIIQVYAPTADKSDDEIANFYKELEVAWNHTKNHEVTVIMGDFNAKVGQGEVEKCGGKFGLGVRNERGGRLVEFWQNKSLVVSNTFFKLPKRRLWTWKSPAHNQDNIIRNQIDFILINDRFKNCVKSAKTYPGADVNSDHNPVVASIEITFKKLKKPSKKQRLDLKKLENADVPQQTQTEINDNLKGI
ncbi:craniofacial development protein 2-like [Sitophilus oryzae]|uniref:Craniofacial development protein 2-like n=1 Tax=Sitophilus oryzae TaxID=7048 RepID=A0A6J2Y1T2_SITOR|nr:craniofacial development protein 2-like [Sitophilus oryzae]